MRTEDSLGTLGIYEYDARGNRTRQTDANGNVALSFHDGLNRLIRQELPENRTVLFAYDVAGNKTAETNPRGLERTFEYDRLNRLVLVTDPAPFAFTRALTYDAVGNRLTETDGRGNTRSFEYDGLNRLVLERDAAPLSFELHYSYDALGNRSSETDRRGIVTTHTYDPEGRRTETRRDGLLILTTAYDAAGNSRFVTDANGHVTGFEYNERNQVLAENRPLAAVTRFTLNDMGDKTHSIDPEGRVTEMTYDVRRRLVSTKNAANESSSYSYDNNGNRLSMTQPKGDLWLYRFDGANRLAEVEDPLANVTTYTYDANSNRLSQTNPRSHATLFEYDELDRMTALVYPDGARETYSYDANGNRTSLVDPKGQTVTSTFDANNRETLRTFSAAVPTTGDDLVSIATVHDPNNNPLTMTEVYSGPSGTRVTANAYDTFDRLVEVTEARGERIAYTYDTNGNRTGVTDPDSRTTLYAFDALNRMTSATVAGSGITEYTYFKDSLLKRVIYPNGSRATNTYDGAGRIATIENSQGVTATISSYAYLYDLNGNRIEQRETNGGAPETTTYGYDTVDRLLEVAYPDKRVVYSYDPAGNRETEVASSLTGTVLSSKLFTYDSRNRATSVVDSTDAAGSAAYTYDTNGNQISRTQGGVVTSFLFDVRDQVAEVGQSGTLLETYRYDYRGLRIKKSGPEGLFRYVYDDDSVLLQTDDLGNTVAKYEYSSDRLLSLLHATEGRQFYLFDGLDSVSNLVKPDGALSIRYQWDAWGNLRSSTGASFNPFGFTGYEKDQATGLFYAKARFYDPVLGRFLTEDPVTGDPQNPPSLHRYTYAFQNPTVYFDPTGRETEPKQYKWENKADIPPGKTVYYLEGRGYFSADQGDYPPDDTYRMMQIHADGEAFVPNEADVWDKAKSAASALWESWTSNTKDQAEDMGKRFGDARDRTDRANPRNGDEEDFDAANREYKAKAAGTARMVVEETAELGVEVGKSAGKAAVDIEGARGAGSLLDDAARGLKGLWSRLRGQGAKDGVEEGAERVAVREGVGAGEEAGGLPRPGNSPPRASATPAASGGGGGQRRLPLKDQARIDEVNKTLDRIESGGPFPHKKDGTVFQNKEGRLPSKGEYREYTVETPSATNRGTRRIVVDQKSGRMYYTDDHYKTFVQVDPNRY